MWLPERRKAVDRTHLVSAGQQAAEATPLLRIADHDVIDGLPRPGDPHAAHLHVRE
jgi:hypothetical protein